MSDLFNFARRDQLILNHATPFVFDLRLTVQRPFAVHYYDVALETDYERNRLDSPGMSRAEDAMMSEVTLAHSSAGPEGNDLWPTNGTDTAFFTNNGFGF